MAAERLLTSAQVARELGISAKTLLRYEGRGWLTPERILPSGHRRWLLSAVKKQLGELPEDAD